MVGGKKRKRVDEATPVVPVEDPIVASFAETVARRAEVFAGAENGQEIAADALAVVKTLFDRSLADESSLLSHYSTILERSVPTRTRTRRKRGKGKKEENPLLQPTPLSELVIDGLPDEQLWEQIELRASKVNGLVANLMSGGQEATAAITESEEMDVDEVDLTQENGQDAADDSDDPDYNEFEEGGAEKSESDDEEELPSDAEISFTTLNDSRRSPARAKRLALEQLDDLASSSNRKAGKPGSPVDDEFFSLETFLKDSSEGEAQMRRAINGATSANEDDHDSDLEILDLFQRVDEGAMDEEAEGDDEANADISYADFFDPPAKAPTKKPRSSLSAMRKLDAESSDKRRVSFSEQVMVKPIAARKGTTSFAALVRSNGLGNALAQLNPDVEEASGDNASATPDEPVSPGSDSDSEEEASEEDQQGSEEEEEDGETIQALNDDLFADEDAEMSPEADGESSHEKRMKALKKQIAQLEAENIAEKEWTMRGEASAKSRPLNSLLEEDLDFENVAKPVPQVTSEVTASLEDRIKKRILEDDFDDVVRRRPFDPAAYLPSRLLDIAGTQSDKSLAELYEDEFSAERQRAEGNEVVHPANARLEKEHKEIEQLYEDLCAKLDALSNARFTPRAPQTTISTVINTPAISLETALPATQAAGTLLAPEEVYAPNSGADPAAVKQELTPSEKKAARQRKKRQHDARQNKLTSLSGKKAGSVKSQKQDALTKLVGNRGVTVIGKASKMAKTQKGKAALKAQASVEKRGSAALKL